MAIRKATTDGTRGLICLYSESGGGKTLSALIMARGMIGPNGKLVLIDTENRRGEIYADDERIPNGYDVLPLNEPFSPAAYVSAIKEAEAYGADAIVVDSGSHEWEGPGGVLDMAVAAANGGQPSFGHWNKPKAAHKKLIQRLQRSPAHVIVCLRAQYKSHQIEAKDFARYGIQSSKKTEIIRDDFQSPIQDANFIFEMTVHLQFSNQAPGVPIVTKCPDMLLQAFPEGEQITIATGQRMAAFYNSRSPYSQAASDLIKEARRAAAKGADEYQAFFTGLEPGQRRELATLGEHEALKAMLADQAVDDDPRDDDPDNAPAPENLGSDNAPRDYVPPNFDDDQFEQET